jgi:uncharacterized membrane protein
MPIHADKHPATKPGLLHQFWSQLWRTAITGIMVWIPLMVTVWVTWFFTDKLILGVENFIRDTVVWMNHIGDTYPSLRLFAALHYQQGLGVLIAALIFLSTGFLTRYVFGRKLIAFGEHIVQRIPVVNRIYRATMQIRDALVNRPGAAFHKVCLIEFPRPGLWTIGFVTSENAGVINNVLGPDLIAIFVPTTPNPTGGYLMYTPAKDVIYLEISVEDAMKTVVSVGAFAPIRETTPKQIERMLDHTA